MGPVGPNSPCNTNTDLPRRERRNLWRRAIHTLALAFASYQSGSSCDCHFADSSECTGRYCCVRNRCDSGDRPKRSHHFGDHWSGRTRLLSVPLSWVGKALTNRTHAWSIFTSVAGSIIALVFAPAAIRVFEIQAGWLTYDRKFRSGIRLRND